MPAKPSALVDTRVISCGDNLDQLRKLPDFMDDIVDTDAFETVMMREERMLVISLASSLPATPSSRSIAFGGKRVEIKPLTIREILNEELTS